MHIWASTLVSLFLAAFTQSTQHHVVAKGLDQEGLFIMPATSPEAARVIQRTVGRVKPPAIEAMLPYSVVLTNSTKKRLVFYALRWTSSSNSGTKTFDDRMYYNLTTLRGGYAVGPGETSLVTVVDALNRPMKPADIDDFTLRYQQTRMDLSFQRQTDIVVSLDVAIFSNGEVVGPDTSKSLVHAHARLQSAHDLYAAFEERRGQREPAAFFISWLKELHAKPQTGFQTNVEKWQQFYKSQLAEELIRVYEEGGENAFKDRLQQCFRTSLNLSR